MTASSVVVLFRTVSHLLQDTKKTLLIPQTKAMFTFILQFHSCNGPQSKQRDYLTALPLARPHRVGWYEDQ